MALKNQVKNVYGVGLNNVGSYQTSGKPFVTASTLTDGAEKQIEFPEISNNITVKLDSAIGASATQKALKTTQEYYFGNTNPSLAILPEKVTIVMWIKWEGPEDGTRRYLFYSHYFRLMYRNNTNTVRVQYHDGTFKNNDSVSFDLSSFTQIILAIDHVGVTKMYINGSEVVSLDFSSTNLSTATSPTVGLGDFGNSSELVVTEFALFRNYVFTPVEASEAYCSGKYLDLRNHSRSAKLSNYLLFDTTQGDTISHDGSQPSANIQDRIGSMDFSIIGLTGGETGTPIEEQDHVFSDVCPASAGTGGKLRVHFRSTGSLPNVATNKHYWTLDSQNESITMNVKSKELYLSADGGDCDYSVEAELTNIPSSRMFQHTGSGVDE